MKPYKKEILAYEWNCDEKPRGKDKQMVSQKVRAQLKVQLNKEKDDALKKLSARAQFARKLSF